MVKNLNTIERSERIRLGKYTPDEQTINSIIINASSQLIDANTSGFHVAPIRKDSSITANTLVYNVVTKEIVDSGCLLYTSPSPRDKRQSRMPSSA